MQGTAWHLSRYLTRLYVDGSAILVIAHMEVRRIVVGQIHRNDDSVEMANLWHVVSLFIDYDDKDINNFVNLI